MARQPSWRLALAVLALLLCGSALGQAFGATGSTIYTPVVLKGGPPPLPSLAGNVAFFPLGWEERPAHPRAYVVVLDVGGSMALNFNGQAVIDGQVLQCGLGPDEVLNQRWEADAPFCAANGDDLWPTVAERRIYLAKQELTRFIDLLEPDDWMQIVVSSGVSPSAVGPVGSGRYGDSAGKEALKQTVLYAGMVNGDPYLTRGGRPTATALARVRTVLEQKAPRQTPGGQVYQAAVVLITDGVANHYRDTSNGSYLINGAAGPVVGWLNQAQDQQPQCAGEISDRPDCHSGYANTLQRTIARPLMAMINEGTGLQQDTLVFVVTLGNLRARTAFAMTASSNQYPWFAPVGRPELLDDALRQIHGNSDPSLQPLYSTRGWQYEIEPDHAPDPTVLPGVDTITMGFATLTGTDGLTRTAPIQLIPVGSATRLTYSFDNVPLGSYTLSAWIGYQGDDGVTRRYDTMVRYLLPSYLLGTFASQPVVVEAGTSLNNTIVVDPLWLICNEQSDPVWRQCTR